MLTSTDRILATHTDSLPRPPELLAELLRRADGEPVDEAALAAQVRDAVADSARRQTEAGVAVVDDGEAGEIGYSTYIERPELVPERIVRYAKLVGRESMLAGTDCGVASLRDPRPSIRRSCGRSSAR